MPQTDADMNWSRREPKKAGARVFEMVLAQEGNFGWRHSMAARGAQAYSQCGLGDLWQGISPYDTPDRGSRNKRPKRFGGWQDSRQEAHARAACETLHEKLVGTEETKTQMVGTDLPWEKRRQGVWADRFIEGSFHLPQGTYLDTWDSCRHGFLLAAAATGTVFMRTEPDYVSKKVRNELRSGLQTFIDPGDCGNGRPLSFFDVTWENPEYLIEDERFKKHADTIWKLAKIPPFHDGGDYDGVTFGTKMIKLTTAWRMPFGSFKGRHAVFADAESLLWEEWAYPEPPLAAFRMNRCLGDPFWSENFIEIMLNPLLDAQDIDEKAKINMQLLSQAYVSMSGKTKLPTALVNALNVNVFRYDANKGESAPDVTLPPMINEQYFQWRDRKILVAQQLAGMPLLHIASQSLDPGASGRSKRMDAGLMPERFAKKLRDWRHWVAVDIGRNNIRAAREIGKVEPDWQVTWPGADFDAKVSVKVLDIDDSIYELRPYAVSEMKNTPSDRAAAADEMLDRDEITKEQHTAIIAGVYDTAKETKGGSIQRKYVSKVMDEMLYAEEDVISDEASYMAEKYLPPPPWLDATAALSQAFETYLTAYIDGVPQNRRVLLRRFLEDIQVLKAQQDKADAMKNASVSLTGDVSALGGQPQQPPPMGGPNGPGPDLGIAPPAPSPSAGMGAPGAAMPPPNVGGPPGMA